MKIATAVTDAYWRFREAWNFAAIENRWRRAGHPSPHIAACNEVFYRAEYLERFRDFASDEYLANGTELDAAKTAFIKAELSATTSILDRKTTAMLRDVIIEMSATDALHPEALAKWEADADALIAELRLEAKQLYGPSGRAPLVRRVLRRG